MDVRRLLVLGGVAFTLLVTMIGAAPAAFAAPQTHAQPNILCSGEHLLGEASKMTTAPNSVPGTIYAKVYEYFYQDGGCFHEVFAEATWQSSGGPASSGSITANLQGSSHQEYQQKTVGIGGTIHQSIDTDPSSEPDTCFYAITATSWNDSVSTGCLHIL